MYPLSVTTALDVHLLTSRRVIKTLEDEDNKPFFSNRANKECRTRTVIEDPFLFK
jgi:hypothetical protein